MKRRGRRAKNLIIRGEKGDLKTFARKFSNIDFFLRILPLKDDELVMSEMQKKWGVTDFVLEITCREEHPKSENSGFFTE